MKFKVTWSSGKDTEFETNECEGVDAFAMRRWGMNSAAQVFEEYGVKLEVAEDDEVLAADKTADAAVAAEAEATAAAAAEAAPKAPAPAKAKK